MHVHNGHANIEDSHCFVCNYSDYRTSIDLIDGTDDANAGGCASDEAVAATATTA